MWSVFGVMWTLRFTQSYRKIKSLFCLTVNVKIKIWYPWNTAFLHTMHYRRLETQNLMKIYACKYVTSMKAVESSIKMSRWAAICQVSKKHAYMYLQEPICIIIERNYSTSLTHRNLVFFIRSLSVSVYFKQRSLTDLQ